MKRTSIGGGAYVDVTGAYWARPTLNHRRTWRKLVATGARAAIKEANTAEFAAKGETFESLAKLWMDSGCPGKRDKSLATGQLEAAKVRAEMLVKFFGKFRSDEIRLLHLPDYAKWRRRRMIRKTTEGGRTIDLDLVTLSNILRFGVFKGMVDANHIRADRPRYQSDVRHAREVMPESAEIIHQVAAALLSEVRCEVMGWLSFFSEFTGCRTSELLRLRRDAKNSQEAGFVEWLSEAERKERADDTLGHLYLGRRSKNGQNPWAKIGPEFAEMMLAFFHWHDQRFNITWRRNRETEWFFPGHKYDTVIAKGSFGHSLTGTTMGLKLAHVTPHGYRAFYATKRLRDGARPVDIAAEMGDKTVALVETIYADNPDGKKLWWSPADGLPAWHSWLPTGKKVDSLWTTVKNSSDVNASDTSKSGAPVRT